MSVIRFCSDPHFSHRNMAIRRGFKDEIEMNEYIVTQWNKTVSKRDVTYILGDITMEKNDYEILNRLNGFKKIVLGNHDKPQHSINLAHYVNSVAGMIDFKDKEFGKIILTHCPIHPQELQYRFSFNIHGHVHENSIDDKRYINVCMEMIDYTPKLLKELM